MECVVTLLIILILGGALFEVMAFIIAPSDVLASDINRDRLLRTLVATAVSFLILFTMVVLSVLPGGNGDK